jgi:hypothetical protein
VVCRSQFGTEDAPVAGARFANVWLSSAIPDLLPLADDARAFKAKAEETFSEVLAVVLRNSQEAKLSIPDWAMPLIQEEFHIH